VPDGKKLSCTPVSSSVKDDGAEMQRGFTHPCMPMEHILVSYSHSGFVSKDACIFAGAAAFARYIAERGSEQTFCSRKALHCMRQLGVTIHFS
jgi:hypothetical protein